MTSALVFGLVILLQTAGFINEVSQFSSATTNEARFDALTSLLRAHKLTFAVEPFTINRAVRGEPRTEGRNVVVTIGEGAKEIVIGAHYDAARIANGSLSKGAVDNAASAVILAHLAETLASEKLSMRVRFVWFDMEELGLIGSQRYIEKHSASGIAAMLNFDVDAYGDTILFGPSERAENRDLRRALMMTCARENATCVAFRQMPPSDDRSFVTAGVPTLSIGILPGLDVHQVWLMENGGPNSGMTQANLPQIFRIIHTAEDTPDKVNEASMGTIVNFTLSLVRSLMPPN